MVILMTKMIAIIKVMVIQYIVYFMIQSKAVTIDPEKKMFID